MTPEEIDLVSASAARELGIAVGIVGYFISIMYIGASTSAEERPRRSTTRC